MPAHEARTRMVIAEDEVERLVAEALAHSDMDRERLRALASEFIRAHGAAPGRASVEVGTRAGGSALLQLRLLERLYPKESERPMLFTVDPYGLKPYHERARTYRHYGPEFYVEQKHLLAPFSNHAHFYLESGAFLTRLGGAAYWQHGERSTLRDFAFVLLDGEHTPEAVSSEIGSFQDLGARAILIDNFGQVRDRAEFPYRDVHPDMAVVEGRRARE